MKASDTLQKGLSIIPNPASSSVKLIFSAAAAGNANISIFNLSGQAVYKADKAGSEGSNDIDVDVQELSNGIYIVKVLSGDTILTGKLIKE